MEALLSIISKLFNLFKPFYWREINRIKKELIRFGANNNSYNYNQGLTCNVTNEGSKHYKRAISYLEENSFLKRSDKCYYPLEAVIILHSTKTKKKIFKELKNRKR